MHLGAVWRTDCEAGGWGRGGGEGRGRGITALVQRAEGAIMVCSGWGQLVEGGKGLNIAVVVFFVLLFHLIFSLKLLCRHISIMNPHKPITEP